MSDSSVELGPELIELGEVVGILRPWTGAGDARPVVGARRDDAKTPVVLETAWFNNPLGNDGLGGIAGRIEALLGLLETAGLLDSAEPPDATAGGATDPAHWYPVVIPSTTDASPSGLYLLHEPVPGKPNDGTLSLAFRRKLSGGDVSLQGRAVLPLFRFIGAKGELVAGNKAHPVQLGLSVGATRGSLASHGFGFHSFDVDAKLSASPDVSFAFTGIELPKVGQPQFPGSAAKGTLDLAAIKAAPKQGEEWLTFLFDILVAQLGETAAASVADIRYLLGLVPNSDWNFFKGPAAELSDWFGAKIASKPDSLQRWLHGWFCLFRGLDITKQADNRARDVRGAGTVADPYSIVVTNSPAIAELSLSMGVTDGLLALSARVGSPAYELTGDAGLRLYGRIALIELELPATGKPLTVKTFVPGADVALAFAPRIAGEALFSYRDFDDPAKSVSLGSVELGLSFSSKRVTPRCDAKALSLYTAAARDYPLEELFGGSSGAGAQLAIRVLAEAVKAAYARYGPDEYTSVADFIVKYERLRICNLLIQAVVDFSGIVVAEDADDPFGKALDQLATGLTTWARPGNKDLPGSALKWLVGRVSDPRVMTRTFGPILSGYNSDFTVDGSLIRFQAMASVSLSLGVKDGLFGVWLAPQVKADWLSFGLDGGIGFDADFKSSRPRVSLGVRLSADTARLALPGLIALPELVGDLTDNGSRFSLVVYPRGKVEGAGIAFLPTLAADWLEQLALQLLLPAASDVALSNASVKNIISRPFPGTAAAAEINLRAVLKTSGLVLGDTADVLHLNTFEKLKKLTPEGFLKAVLEVLKRADRIEIVKDKLAIVKRQLDQMYGIQIQIKDLAVSKRTSKLSLQLGKWLGVEDDNKNWYKDAGGTALTEPPGLGLFLVSPDGSFNPSLELISVGLDIEGAAGRPLFNKKGYQLQGLQSRLYFSWRAGGTAKFGAAIQLKEMGIPLGPKGGGESGSKNPVAANLLSSGDAAQGKEDAASNPTFSAVIAYVDKPGDKNKPYGKVFSDMPSADGMAWIPVSRNLGPLHCRQIGLGFNNEEVLLAVGYDGVVALGPLNIDLDHLTVDIPLKEPQNFSDYKLGLAGLDVSYAGGPISISGGFFKNELLLGDSKTTTTQYDGIALIKAVDFSITGFGSYAVIAHDPSLFIFAILHKDLGGPSFFRVKGVAAGFGYNRRLKLPPIEEVHRFPLVCAALDENYFNPPKALNSPHGSSPSKPEDLIQAAMVTLRDYIPPSGGDYWFAAGLRFSSFEMIQSFALLSVSFGHQVEIGLLGMSKMSVPKDANPGSEVAYAELALRAVVKPEEGMVAVEGRLTDRSYIFSKDCRLTGGFAFFLWSSGEHAGDFVVTLGGYHSRFIRPPHYPIVPRLGAHWQVSSELTVTAEMYYALTPSCLMAGGKLSAVFQSGCIKAWYIVYADFLLCWKPFYYLVDMGISIGIEASVRIPLGFVTIAISIRVELSVDLHLWGPPFSGEAHVDLSVISFTIPFGDPRRSPLPLTADEFVATFLPAPKASSDVPDVIAVRINSGLLQQREKDKEVVRVVNAHALSLTAESLVPSTSFEGLAGSAKYKQPEKKRPDLKSTFGIRPMAKQKLMSTFDVRLLKLFEDQFRDHGIPENLRVSFVENGVPDALWGQCQFDGVVALPGNPEANTVTATVGVRFSFGPIDPEHALFPIPLEKLKFAPLRPKKVAWQDPGEAPTIADRRDNTFWKTIWANTEVDARRNAILDILSRESPFSLNKPDLAQLWRSEAAYFQADPEFCTLGEQLA
jgi:hypothetical protein